MTGVVKGSGVEGVLSRWMLDRIMKMRMDMQTAFVAMGVDMKAGAAENFPENAAAQSHEHYSNGKFHSQGDF